MQSFYEHGKASRGEVKVGVGSLPSDVCYSLTHTHLFQDVGYAYQTTQGLAK